MKYLLDTSVLVDAFRGNKNVLDSIQKAGVKNCHVSEISIAELYYGAVKSERQRHYDDIKRVLNNFKILSIHPCFETYAYMKVALEKAGMRVDDLDLFIGATAMYHDLCLVTSNTKHFNRVENIMLENWKI